MNRKQWLNNNPRPKGKKKKKKAKKKNNNTNNNININIPDNITDNITEAITQTGILAPASMVVDGRLSVDGNFVPPIASSGVWAGSIDPTVEPLSMAQALGLNVGNSYYNQDGDLVGIITNINNNSIRVLMTEARGNLDMYERDIQDQVEIRARRNESSNIHVEPGYEPFAEYSLDGDGGDVGGDLGE